jgi:hypothetical protein
MTDRHSEATAQALLTSVDTLVARLDQLLPLLSDTGPAAQLNETMGEFLRIAEALPKEARYRRLAQACRWYFEGGQPGNLGTWFRGVIWLLERAIPVVEDHGHEHPPVEP